MEEPMKLFAIFSLSLGISVAFGKSPSSITLHMTLTRLGTTICDSFLIVEAEKSYLWCEGRLAENRIQSKVFVKLSEDNSILISTNIDQINPSGEVLNISSPRIATLENETAEISELSASGENVLSFSVTPRMP
jgi:hypothetical protein